LEYPNLVTKVLKKSDWENAEVNLKNELNKQFKPIEIIVKLYKLLPGT
jgi:hypothetical protein